MTVITGYAGPSPAAKQFTMQGVQVVEDIWFSPDSSVQFLVAEKNADGSWSYLNGIDEPVFKIFTSDSAVGSDQAWVVPGAPGEAGQVLTFGGGTLAEIVAGRGAAQMLKDFEAKVNAAYATRFPVDAPSTGPSTANSNQAALQADRDAQQLLAVALQATSVNATAAPPVWSA